MKVGLQISSFTWPGGTEHLGETLAAIVRTADDAGFDSIWVMDHFIQIGSVGRPEEPMLEGMTTLGFMAAHSRRARLGLMVGGIHYRQAGLWLKAATTLDVLSGGRAWFGIGAAWNEQESRALGFPMPPLGERFEMLEETLRLVRLGWQDELGSQTALEGRHYQASHLLNSPQSLTRPHPPILIGGGGERRTLKLVAMYGDATNVFGTDPGQLAHKYGVLRRHCETVGRDYEQHREDIPDAGLDHAGRRRPVAHARPTGGAPGPHHGGRRPARHLQRARCPRPLEAGTHRPRRHPAAARARPALSLALSGAWT